MDDEDGRQLARSTRGLCHQPLDAAVALRAVIFDRHRLDRRIVGRDLLGERVIWL